MQRTLVVSLAAAAATLAAAGPAAATYPGGNGRLAFERPVGDRSDVFSIRPDGTGQRRLTHAPAYEERPSWSPDGRRFAFARDVADGVTEIFTASAAGGDVRQVTRWGSVAGAPTWTPDGRIVAFTLKDFPAAADGDPPPPSELYAIGADGTGEVRLTNDETIQTDPDVSPADGTVAFTQWQAVAGEPAGVFDLGIGALTTGGAASTLAPYAAVRDAFNPSWSPDGRRIVFEIAIGTPPQTGTRDGRQSDLAMMDADGTGLVRLTRTGALEATPVWSPDGRKIAFASDRHIARGPRERNGRHFEIYVMRADGTHVRRLTRNRVPDLHPNWQAVPR